MNVIRTVNKKILLALVSLVLFATTMAQDAGNATVKTVESSNNQLAILLIVIMIVLAFVIWGMGQVLVQLGRQAVDKNKKSTALQSVLMLLGLTVLSQTLSAQDKAADVIKVVPNYGGLSETTFYLFITVIATELCTILFLAFSIHRVHQELVPEKIKAPAKESTLRSWWTVIDKKYFTKAIPVEKEADILLDHNYDGIRELDNALPPWWKYGFYITIVIAVIYLFNFHVLGLGQNPTEEYNSEMENARIEHEAYEAQNKDRIDENNVPMADANGLAVAKEIFTTKCWACHGKLGEGGAGPNLTDDYWLHKGSLNDIFHTIKTGYPDKGMQSWDKVYNPKEISYLASYIKTLKGTNPPNPKAPQGELYTETIATPVADTAKAVKKDSTVIKK
jgi:cytochrome c oxidase cbb3-type subunit 3